MMTQAGRLGEDSTLTLTLSRTPRRLQHRYVTHASPDLTPAQLR